MYLTASPITNKQLSFIERLMDERDLAASPKFREATASMDEHERQAYISTIKAGLQDLSRSEASAYIERLLELPRRSASRSASAPAPASSYDVPAGRYAVEREDGALAFYRLDRPTEGRWAGYMFLSVQASDELHPIKGHAAKEAILSKIAADPAGAARRYGQEIGSCAICGRTLTDETSREYGIGPVCRENTGW